MKKHESEVSKIMKKIDTVILKEKKQREHLFLSKKEMALEGLILTIKF